MLHPRPGPEMTAFGWRNGDIAGGVVRGLDVGGTQIRAGVIAQDGRLLVRWACRMPATQGLAAVYVGVLQDVRRELEDVSAGAARCAVVGISAPGPVGRSAGIIPGPMTISQVFRDVPLAALIEQLRAPMA